MALNQDDPTASTPSAIDVSQTPPVAPIPAAPPMSAQNTPAPVDMPSMASPDLQQASQTMSDGMPQQAAQDYGPIGSTNIQGPQGGIAPRDMVEYSMLGGAEKATANAFTQTNNAHQMEFNKSAFMKLVQAGNLGAEAMYKDAVKAYPGIEKILPPPIAGADPRTGRVDVVKYFSMVPLVVKQFKEQQVAQQRETREAGTAAATDRYHQNEVNNTAQRNATEQERLDFEKSKLGTITPIQQAQIERDKSAANLNKSRADQLRENDPDLRAAHDYYVKELTQLDKLTQERTSLLATMKANPDADKSSEVAELTAKIKQQETMTKRAEDALLRVQKDSLSKTGRAEYQSQLGGAKQDFSNTMSTAGAQNKSLGLVNPINAADSSFVASQYPPAIAQDLTSSGGGDGNYDPDVVSDIMASPAWADKWNSVSQAGKDKLYQLALQARQNASR